MSDADAELLYRRVVHTLQHGLRTATYKLATMLALVRYSKANLADRGATDELRIPIAEIAREVIALYWSQVRPFEGRILKQSSQPTSRIVEAVLNLQAAAEQDGSVVSADDAEKCAPEAYRQAVDAVALTLAQQPLPRLQRVPGEAQTLNFLYDDSFLHDHVSRTELQLRGNAILLKPGIAMGLAATEGALERVLASMWLDDVLRLNHISGDRRMEVANHMFGTDHVSRMSAPAHATAGKESRPASSGPPAPKKQMPAPTATFADKLNYLFDSTSREGEPSHTIGEVAAMLRAYGQDVSAAYLTSLRLGLQDNASSNVRMALADVFGVDPTYLMGGRHFTGSGPTHEDVDRLLADLSDGASLSPALQDDMVRPGAVGRHRAVVDDENGIEFDEVADGHGPSDLAVFTTRLNQLFDLHRGPDGGEYTNNQVASSLQDDGLTITEALIARLRRGNGDLPSVQTLDALAFFFDVDFDYFTDGGHSRHAKDAGSGPDTSWAPPPFDQQLGLTAADARSPAGINLTAEALASVAWALSDCACQCLESVHPDIGTGRELVQTLRAIGHLVATSAGQRISIDSELAHRIATLWSPFVSTSGTHDRGYRYFAGVLAEEPPAPSHSVAGLREETVASSSSGRWTLESFTVAVNNPADRAFLLQILHRFSAQTQIIGDHTPFWFGVRPGGGVFLYPFRLRHPPFQFLLDAEDRLTVRGNWRIFPKVAGQDGFAELAEMFGQHQGGPASSVRVEDLDADNLWDVAERTARLINA